MPNLGVFKLRRFFYRNANIFAIFKALPMQLTMHRSALCYMDYCVPVLVNIYRKFEASVVNIAAVTSI